jgi:hypothetical protein
MSLVNDVLRQLDTASSKPYPSMPLHSLTADKPDRNNKLLSLLFIILVMLLLMVLTLQFFYRQPLHDVFPINNQQALEVPKNLGVQKDIIVDHYQAEVSVEDEILVAEIMKQVAEVNLKTDISKSTAINKNPVKSIRAPVNSSNKKNSNVNTSIKDPLVAIIPSAKTNDYQKADIKSVENIGFKQYQLALKSYKQKKTSMALSWINLAIAAAEKDEYLRLKVRILLQKGDREELHQFVLGQTEITNLAWFQLVAPSLQMYSYYELSNKYYSELVKQQPNEVKWQLAMALNFSSLGLEQQTYSIYTNLLNSSLLTYKQQKWIASRLERMEQDRVVINE